jgi:hypothetical protein
MHPFENQLAMVPKSRLLVALSWSVVSMLYHSPYIHALCAVRKRQNNRVAGQIWLVCEIEDVIGGHPWLPITLIKRVRRQFAQFSAINRLPDFVTTGRSSEDHS